MTYRSQLCPWCVVRQLPEMKRTIVDRFRRYQDADAHLQLLRQQSPNSSFALTFEPDRSATPETAV
ncbi:MAG: hypothetical protein ACFBSG_08425 [Leptolyngbyaceae cyanobacterium]